MKCLFEGLCGFQAMLKTAAATAAAILIAGNANAATIVSSDFDGRTIPGGGATAAVTWSGDESSSASDLTAVGGTFSDVNGLLATDDTVYVAPNLNQGGTRGYTFTFTPGSDYDLSNLSVLAGHATGGGANYTGQVYESDLTVSISNGGTVFTDTQTVLHNGAYQTFNYDLDAAGAELTSGTTYTISVTMANLNGAGAFFTGDGVTLEGEAITAVIPEPGTFMLLGLGLAGYAASRRRC